MILLFLKSSNLFVPERAFPLLGYGADKVFLTNLSNLFAFQGIAYILFLQPFLKNKNEFSKINIISIILISIYLFLSVLCILLIFPFIRITQDLLSIYLLTRIVAYSAFISRIDAIYIFFWIVSTLSYLSINLFYSLNIYKKLSNIKNERALAYSFCAILLGSVLLIKRISIYYFLQNIILNNYFLILLAISILILFLSYKKKQKKDDDKCAQKK